MDGIGKIKCDIGNTIVELRMPSQMDRGQSHGPLSWTAGDGGR